MVQLSDIRGLSDIKNQLIRLYSKAHISFFLSSFQWKSSIFRWYKISLSSSVFVPRQYMIVWYSLNLPSKDLIRNVSSELIKLKISQPWSFPSSLPSLSALSLISHHFVHHQQSPRFFLIFIFHFVPFQADLIGQPYIPLGMHQFIHHQIKICKKSRLNQKSPIRNSDFFG